MPTDYWLSKLFYDLQQPQAAAEYRADRAKVLDRYPLSPEARKAALTDDLPVLIEKINPYLLRFYYGIVGMPDQTFMDKLHALPKESGQERLRD